MYKLPFLVYANILSGILPLAAGVLLWRRSDLALRLLAGLLLYGLVNDIGLYLLAIWRGNNMVLIHICTLVSYIIIAQLFSYWHKGRITRYIRLSIPFVFLIYFLLLGLGYQNLQLPDKYTDSITSVLIGFMSLYTLYSAFREHTDFSVYKDQRFWVTFGIFFNYPGSLFAILAVPLFITHQLWQIHHIMVIIGNLLYLGGYLCLRK